MAVYIGGRDGLQVQCGVCLLWRQHEIYQVCDMDSCDMQYDLDSGNNVLRKGRKLLAEKKRRARINTCLGQIKSIICGGHKQDDPTYSKMEKAEILESTVKYLRTIRRGRPSGGSSSYVTKELMLAKYKSGFSKCAEEIGKYLQAHPGIPEHLQRQIRRHLTKRVHQSAVEQTTPVTEVEQFSTRVGDNRISTSAVTGSLSVHGYLNNSLGSSPVREGNSFSESDNVFSTTYNDCPVNMSSSNQATSVNFGKNDDNDARIRAWLQDTYVNQRLSRCESRDQFSSPIVKTEDVWRPW